VIVRRLPGFILTVSWRSGILLIAAALFCAAAKTPAAKSAGAKAKSVKSATPKSAPPKSAASKDAATQKAEPVLPAKGAASETLKPADQYRALWVDAFHEGFKTPEQTENLVKQARQRHFNTLLIEVRKCGDAYYRSDYEPSALDVAPAYDPLAHVVALCHDMANGQPRVEVHAWVVVYKVSRQGIPNPRGHVLKNHPKWVCTDSRGRTVEGDCVYLDPGVPEVVDYTAAVIQDMARKYEVDGVHLDYCRYPDGDWGYNPVAVERFQKQYAKRGKPKADDPDWGQFRRDQVSALVRRVYSATRAVRPKAKISLAAIAYGHPNGDFQLSPPYQQVFQDWAGWLKEGVVDAVFLMNYKHEAQADQRKDYRQWNDMAAQLAGERHVIIGQGSYMQLASLSLTQLRAALATKGLSGVAVYSYAAPTSRQSEKPAFWAALQNGLFAAPVPAPQAKWVEYPRNGALAGKAMENKKSLTGASSAPLDAAIIGINGPTKRTIKTDGSGCYVLAELPPGRYSVRVTTPDRRYTDALALIVPGRVTRCDLTVK